MLVGGSALAQVIGVLASPLLSRLYTPSEFGILGSVLAVTGILSFLTSLKYDMAIVIENDEEQIDALQDLNTLLVIGISIISGIGIFFAPYFISSINHGSELAEMLLWGIGIIFFSGLYNSFYSRFNRERAYKPMALSQIIRRSSTTLSQLAFGFFGATSIGLVLSNVIGSLVPVMYILYNGRDYFHFRKFSFEKVKNAAKKHYKFPLYIAPQSLINLISGQLPVFLLGYYFSISIVGQYFFALKIAQIPAMFIGLSVRQVFFKEIADNINDTKNVIRLYSRFTLGVAAVMLIPIIILFFFGPRLFDIVFGEEWKTAGIFASWIFLWYGTNIIAGPARSLFISLDKQKTIFFDDVTLFIFRGSALVALPLFYNATIVIAVASLISTVYNILIIFWCFLLIDQSLRKRILNIFNLFNVR